MRQSPVEGGSELNLKASHDGVRRPEEESIFAFFTTTNCYQWTELNQAWWLTERMEQKNKVDFLFIILCSFIRQSEICG